MIIDRKLFLCSVLAVGMHNCFKVSCRKSAKNIIRHIEELYTIIMTQVNYTLMLLSFTGFSVCSILIQFHLGFPMLSFLPCLLNSDLVYT